MAWKMTNCEVDGVSVMELDRHIVFGEPRSSADPSRIDAKRGDHFLEADFGTVSPDSH